jgi:hypothetical protein
MVIIFAMVSLKANFLIATGCSFLSLQARKIQETRNARMGKNLFI